MHITPNSTIRILSGVPLTNTYRDVLTFGSLTEQARYFYEKTKFVYANSVYQRYTGQPNGTPAVHVEIEADKLFDCNYMMFQNTSHGNKWFYAFITNVEYVNENMSRIFYELDVMQTWKFDYTIKQCFVEREHTNDDRIGANRIPENLDTGDYVSNNYGVVASLTPANCAIMIAATFDKQMNDAVGGYYGYLYSGLVFNQFNNATSANAFIELANRTGKADGIVSIFPFPVKFIPPAGAAQPVREEIQRKKHYTDIDGYHPKNNKLFTYPYNFLYVTNNAGNSAEFKYEFFEEDPCPFNVFGALSCNPEFVLAPRNYKLTVSDDPMNSNEMMTISGFPQCPYVTDVYKVYLAQHSSQLSVQAWGAAVSGVGHAVTGNVSGLIQDSLSVEQTLASLKDMDRMPPQAHGNSAGVTNYAAYLNNFSFYDMHITRYYAQIIDEYFSMYGYKTNRVKVPNVTGRQSWNYVKTKNAQIIGSIPADDLARIRGVFDSGVTFWHTNDVGNYSLNNSIV